jgi:hypothetical protein
VDVDVELVDEPGELVDLLRLVELGLVADEVVHALAVREGVDDEVPEVEGVGDLLRSHRQAQARGQHRGAHPVELGEDEPMASPGPVVVVHLEGQGGLAAVHRPGEEHQLGHDSAA